MLTGAIPEEYRRVTGCAQEGNRKVTGRLPECTGDNQSLHKSAEVEIPTYGRDLVGYWR